MGIENDRNQSDFSCLESSFWSGILVGTDGYPKKDESDYYLIAGGENMLFKAIAIEFYGVKTQIWLKLLIVVIIIKSHALVRKKFVSCSLIL